MSAAIVALPIIGVLVAGIIVLHARKAKQTEQMRDQVKSGLERYLGPEDPPGGEIVEDPSGGEIVQDPQETNEDRMRADLKAQLAAYEKEYRGGASSRKSRRRLGRSRLGRTGTVRGTKRRFRRSRHTYKRHMLARKRTSRRKCN